MDMLMAGKKDISAGHCSMGLQMSFTKSNGGCIGRNVFDTLVIEKHCIVATLLQNFVFPFLFALTAYIHFFP